MKIYLPEVVVPQNTKYSANLKKNYGKDVKETKIIAVRRNEQIGFMFYITGFVNFSSFFLKIAFKFDAFSL